MKTYFFIAVLTLACLLNAPLRAAAQDAPATPAPATPAPAAAAASSGDIDMHYGAGYLMPYEGDLDGGPIVGLGLEYTKNNESVFLEYLFSSTSQDVSTLIGDVEHRILQAAYLAPFKNQKKMRLGAGVQVHQMKLTGIGAKATRTMLLGLVEYDFSDSWAARLQATTKDKENGTDFGGVSLIFVFRP
jgi:hypothetical protein